MGPARIQAQILRRQPGAPAGGAGSSAAMPDTGAAATPRKGSWRQADVRRAIAAAAHAGLRSYRIEIAPDGTIAIVVGDPADTAPPDPYGGLSAP